MKYLGLILFMFLQSCGTMVVMDESYTTKNPVFQKTFTASRAKCESAVVKSFKDLGSSLQEKNASELVSEKWVVHEGAYASGSAYSAVATKFEQKAKLYVRVQPREKGCSVLISRVRAWNNNVEFEKLELGFTKARVVDPFFKSIAEYL
jgi:hypothetical protein